MKAQNVINPTSALNILNQLPGIITCLDVNHKFTFCNEISALTFGFKNAEEMLGVTPFNIRCKAAESADLWIKQNNEVVNNKVPLTVLDIHPYVNDKNLVLLTKKNLFKALERFHLV